MARKLAAAHGLGDDDVIVSRAELDELQGRLYCLQRPWRTSTGTWPRRPSRTTVAARRWPGWSRTPVPAAAAVDRAQNG